MDQAFLPVAVIPVYNHGEAVGAVAANVRSHGLRCILVDDGSSAECAAVLDALAQAPDVTLVRLAVNQGKGGAMMAGLRAAAAAGHSHALQIDADGQHDAGDIPRFLAHAAAQPQAVICGTPVYDESCRRFGWSPAMRRTSGCGSIRCRCRSATPCAAFASTRSRRSCA